MVTSCPTVDGTAVYFPFPRSVNVPPVMDACMLLAPPTEMLMGFSNPAYSTFMRVADTVANPIFGAGAFDFAFFASSSSPPFLGSSFGFSAGFSPGPFIGMTL